MDIVEDHALSLEETFVYLVGIGKSKSDAYRAIVDCSELSNELIASRAWKYSLRPSVLAVSANEEENLYVKYAKGRDIAFDTLIELTNDAQSEFVRQQSANALLSQTSKLAKLNVDVNLNVKSELSEALDELRGLLLAPPTGETPQGFLPEDKKALYENNQIPDKVPESDLNYDIQEAEIVSESELNQDVILNAHGVPYTNDAQFTLDGKEVTQEVYDEQVEGINPSHSMGTTEGRTNRGEGETGAFRDSGSGRFVSNEKAKYELSKMIKGKQDEHRDK